MSETSLSNLIESLTEYADTEELLFAWVNADITNAIIKKRSEMELSQAEFAKFLGISQSAVSKIESNNENFTIKRLIHLAQKLTLKLTVKLEEHTKVATASCNVGTANFIGVHGYTEHILNRYVTRVEGSQYIASK